MLRNFFRAIANIIRVLLIPLRWPIHRLSRPKGEWLRLKLMPRVVDIEAPLVFWKKRLGIAKTSVLHRIRKLMAQVGSDPRLKGVFIELPPLQCGWVECCALRDVIRGLRDLGKQVIVYLPEGGGNQEYYVASSADQIWTSPQASLGVLGIGAEFHYPKRLLDRLGVELQVFACGEFKTAAESLVRTTMSVAQREQMDALLQTRHEALTTAISARFSGDTARAERIYASSPLTGANAQADGIVDAVCYPDETYRLLTGSDKSQWVTPSRYLRWSTWKPVKPWRRASYIAVIEVHGPIVLHSAFHTRRASERSQLVAQLKKVRKDPHAIGLLLHIDSPGGSALASDFIHREVCKTREDKPVVAYFANVAASGGYYIAQGAHAIVAEPLSITGSIGVISAKPVLQRLFSHAGIDVHTLRKAPHPDMFSATRELDDEEQAIMKRETKQFYESFVKVVAEGRRWDFARVESVARGRVWSGKDAHHHGLVDHLGGVETAVTEILKRAYTEAPSRTDAVELKVFSTKAGKLSQWAPFNSALDGQRGMGQALDLLNLCLGSEKVFYYGAGLPIVG
ncbi:MAG: signal peptide peptidase SppA [Myxococcales bacterium]|nr:signal peptide peptidase SppA [Myxococcales bacterium]MCB9709185.1 signal peptide peptidase SppA [Myxococcales bacterium]